MKIAMISADDRESFRKYDLKSPIIPVPQKALLSGFADIPNLEVHYVSCAQVRMDSPSLLASNIFFHPLHVPKLGWLRSGYAGCISAVRRKLRELQPDLVHAQGTERDCAISTVFSPFPKVLTIHGNIRSIAKLQRCRLFSFWWLQARLERFCIPRFDGIVCISKYTRDLTTGIAKKTWLLPNAVDAAFFDIRRQEASGLPVILVVANVNALKNQINLIHSLEHLSKQRRFQVRFFGKSGGDSYGREFLGLVETRPWCFWGGMLGREELRREFANASALMLPTREDNCPLVVLEAQAAGVPVIASNVGGVPDLIQSEQTGILTNPSQPETMPMALARLLANPELARRLAEEGRKQAKSRFHPKVIAEKHLEIYREVIASR